MIAFRETLDFLKLLCFLELLCLLELLCMPEVLCLPEVFGLLEVFHTPESLCIFLEIRCTRVAVVNQSLPYTMLVLSKHCCDVQRV